MSERAFTYGAYKLFAVALMSCVVGLGLANSSPVARLGFSDDDAGSLHESESSETGAPPGPVHGTQRG